MVRFLERLEAEVGLCRLVQGHPDFADFAVLDVLKAGPDQVTATAMFKGDKVVLKRALKGDVGRQVEQAKQELDTLAPVMTGPKYRVNACIAAYPDLGVIVLSCVPGVRLDKAITAADRAARAELMTLSGGWLKTYCSNRSDVAQNFSPDWWIKTRIAAFGSDQPGDVQGLFDRVVHRLNHMAAGLRGTAITKAAVHADFVSLNAHYHQGTIYGVDIQGTARFPIVQDVAKFLVWTQLQTPLKAPQAPMDMGYVDGVAEPDVTAFLASGVLPPPEARSFLPFFTGLQVLGSIRAFQADAAAMVRVRQMVDRFADGR